MLQITGGNMATYDFGQVILNAIQAEDQLNLRRQEIERQQQQFLMNYGLTQQLRSTEQQRLDWEQNKPRTSVSQYGVTVYDPLKGTAQNISTGVLNPQITKDIESQYMKTSEIPADRLKDFPQSMWTKGTDINRMNAGQYVSPDENYISKNAYTTKLGSDKQTLEAANIKSEIADRNSAMAKRNYDINSSKSDKAAKKIAGYQDTYNSIMGAQRMTLDDLQAKGLLTTQQLNNIDDLKSKYGGAYVVEGKGKPKVFFTDSDLENYAKQQVPKLPEENQWSRSGQQNSDNKTSMAIPQGAIDYLKANPNLKDKFDEQFGKGMASKYLGGK